MSEDPGNGWKKAFEAGRARAERIVILGIGHEWRGDDAAGLLFARDLEKRIASPGTSASKDGKAWLVMEGAEAPENQTGRIRAFRPDLIVLVDAARGGRTPGKVYLIDKDLIAEEDLSSHRIPLSFLVRFLEDSIGALVMFIGIEPESMAWQAPLSPAVRKTVAELVEYFARQR